MPLSTQEAEHPDGMRTPSGVEMKVVLAAFVLFVAALGLGIPSLLQPPRIPPALRTEDLTPVRTFSVLQPYLQGTGCVQHLQQAAVSFDGPTARVEIAGIGVFEVRSRHLGLYTVRPLSPVSERGDCRYIPRYIGLTT
jgi:hypothetical protein